MSPAMPGRALLLLLALAAPAAADTLRVPQDFATPQAAVDAALPGDTILVGGGPWAGPLVVQGKSELLLRGLGKPLVDAAGLDTGITLSGCSQVELRGFAVEGAGVAGILVEDGSDVLVTRCRVKGAHVGVWAESGIRVSGGSGVRVERNHVVGDVILGIRLFAAEGPQTDGATVLRNHVHHVWHSGIEAYGTGLLLERNRVHDSASDGLFCDMSSSIARRNRVKGGLVGLTVFGGDGNLLERNRITGASEMGLLSSPAATGTTLVKNRVTHGGAQFGVSLQGDGFALDHDRVAQAEGDGLVLASADGTAVGVRVLHPGGDGVTIEAGGGTFTDVRVTGAGGDGFHVAGTDNTLVQARASASGDLDLDDPNGEGANEYVDCSFGTSNLE